MGNNKTYSEEPFLVVPLPVSVAQEILIALRNRESMLLTKQDFVPCRRQLELTRRAIETIETTKRRSI